MARMMSISRQPPESRQEPQGQAQPERDADEIIPTWSDRRPRAGPD